MQGKKTKQLKEMVRAVCVVVFLLAGFALLKVKAKDERLSTNADPKEDTGMTKNDDFVHEDQELLQDKSVGNGNGQFL